MSSSVHQHPHEGARQAAVELFKQLDPRVQANFNRAARILQRIAETSITGFSLLDGQRHLFRPAFGSDLIVSERSQTFCARTILSDAPFVVEDAHDDEIFSSCTFVTGEPYVRFYAGIAIRSRDRLPIGALCAMDGQPRRFEQRISETLLDLREILENDLALVG